jgi:hypothetical protein
LQACLAGWGILEIPLIKNMKDLVVHKLHEIGDNLTPKKVLQKALPFLVD